MSDKELTSILGRCLGQIAAGETVSACLAGYPEHAAELAPLLAMARELETLGGHTLSEAARQRTRTKLRQAETTRRSRRTAPWWRPGSLLAPRAAAGLVAALFCVILTTGLVAASQPGDPAYGVRVAVERAPALLAGGANERARAELGIASRRLADLDRSMSSQQQALDGRAVSALLASAETAAEIAAGRPEAEQVVIAALLAEQADALAQLGRAARQPKDAEALLLASERTHRAAERASRGVPMPDPQPAGSLHGPTASATAGPHGTPAPEHTPSPYPKATETASPTPAQAIASPTRITPSSPGPSATAPSASPRATSPGPGPNATSPGPGPRATSPGPAANAPPSAPGPSATSASSGPRATSPGPGANATPSDPGASATSPGPGGQGR